MARIGIRLPVTFNNPALPILASADDAIIGALPGIQFWLDPRSAFEPSSGGGLRERINNRVFTAVGGYTLDAAIGGQPTLSLVEGENLSYFTPAVFDFMESEYTIVSVFQRTEVGLGRSVNVFGGSGTKGVLRIHTTDKLVMFHAAGSFGTGVSASAADTIDANPHILMASWDAVNGIHYEVDGVVKAPDQAITTPIDFTGVASIDIGSGANVQPPTWHGYTVAMNVNYAKAAYADDRQALYTLLSDKYGIAV